MGHVSHALILVAVGAVLGIIGLCLLVCRTPAPESSHRGGGGWLVVLAAAAGLAMWGSKHHKSPAPAAAPPPTVITHTNIITRTIAGHPMLSGSQVVLLAVVAGVVVLGLAGILWRHRA